MTRLRETSMPTRRTTRRKTSQDTCSILLVDDEPYILATLGALLENDYEVLTAASAAEARAIFENRSVDLILSDQRMPRESGVSLLKWVCQESPHTVRMLMTGFAELEDAVDAINNARIFSYIFKPWQPESLLETLSRAARLFRLERDNQQLVKELKELNLELETRVDERTRQLAESNHALEQKNRMLERLALTDPLTSLPNRRAMDRLVEREIRRRERYAHPLAIGLLDIDHFKQVNSQYLLPGGDRVLVDFTKCVAKSLRTVDVLGRIGGEEFLVLAPETEIKGAEVLGERIRSTVQDNTFRFKEHSIHITVSSGFVVAEEGVIADFEQLKDAASAALAEAKITGRNRCIIYAIGKDSVEQAG